MTEHSKYSDRHSPGPFNLATQYDSVETTVSGTDYSFKDNTTLFDSVEYAREILIRSEGTIQVKFNSSSHSYFTMISGESLTFTDFVVGDVLVTTVPAGSEVGLKILIVGL